MNEIVQVANPLGGALEVARPSGASAMASTDQQRAIAEVQAAMVVARSNPRNQVQAMDRILNACQRKTLAEQAIYQYARGGENISGPSIRLAEAMAQNWGNIQFGMRELEQTGGMSSVLAYAWDLETNVRQERVFNVPHTRHTRSGSYPLKDPRDIYELIANQGQRRVRACILGVIPGDIIDAAVAQCENTMNAYADTSPEGIQKMVEAFSEEFGVTKQQLEARVQRRIDTIQPAQMVALKKIYRSLRDDMSNAEDWFEPIEVSGAAEQSKPASGNSAAKDTLKKQVAKKPAKVEPAPAAAEQGAQVVDETTGASEQASDSGVPAAEVPASDFYGNATPANAMHGQSWYKPEDQKLRFAHQTEKHGIKWYLAPPRDEPEPEPEPASQTDVGISLYRVISDKIGDAEDIDTLNEVQDFFGESKPKLSDEEVGILRNALAERRNELS